MASATAGDERIDVVELLDLRALTAVYRRWLHNALVNDTIEG